MLICRDEDNRGVPRHATALHRDGDRVLVEDALEHVDVHIVVSEVVYQGIRLLLVSIKPGRLCIEYGVEIPRLAYGMDGVRLAYSTRTVKAVNLEVVPSRRRLQQMS